MKRGCFVTLVILGGCVGAYWYVLHGRVEPPALWWGAGLAGFFMWMSIGTLRTAIAAAQDASRVSSETTFTGYTGQQYEDGATVTVAGHMRAVGQSLRAPFSGKPAVLVSYEIEHVSQTEDGDTNAKDYSGFALAPCAVESPRGSIRLLGFPVLEGFDKVSLDTFDARKNAAAYLGSTNFTEMKGLHPGLIYKDVKELLTDEDGEFRKDWKMTEDTDVSDKLLYEQLVAPGDQVCAIGRWSEAKRGLVAPSGSMIRLVKGDPQQVVGGLRGKVIGNVIGGLILAALANGAIYVLLQVAAGRLPQFKNTPLAQHAIHKDEMQAAIMGGDLGTAEKLLANGTGLELRDSDGRTPLATVADAHMARWLIAHGADVNAARPNGETVLMEQASAGHTEIVRVLLNAGAKLDAVSSEWHTTALQQAQHAEHMDIVRLLHDAGAKDDTITETNGQTLRDTDAPVVAAKAYLTALDHEDIANMKAHSTFTTFGDVDFKLWKSSRPVYPKFVSGYGNADSATMQFRGATPSGVYVTWTYQLVRRASEWRVDNERWETRLSSNEP